MNSDILTFPDLKEITGYMRPGDVERCLKKQGVRFFYSKAGPWTTMDLINAAGGLRPDNLPKTGTDDIL